jgi:5-methylcytosine-specific restriction endonuclease McrA
MAPRLTTLKPKLNALAPRLGHAPGDEKARLRERERNTPNRKWYHSQRWKDLRVAVLKRDQWTCQQTGTICTGAHPAANSPVVDHIKPHHWDERLFWDINNLQTVTKAYHDSEKQKQERRQGR